MTLACYGALEIVSVIIIIIITYMAKRMDILQGNGKKFFTTYMAKRMV